ncbi:DUF6214 family protein [Streptomyces sp. Q6]|uniref:DUF6214 family protein n=1 Tax=Streptomyces citrinus TaxID=3118173 RepID=A0ACD5A5Y9_9ACTN
MLESSFFDVSDHFRPESTVSAGPRWEIHGPDPTTRRPEPDRDAAPGEDCPPPWFHVRLALGDGAHADVLAVVADGRVAIEDVRVQPPLSADEFAALARWIEGPLEEACRGAAEQQGLLQADLGPRGGLVTAAGEPAGRRARPAWPRGTEGRRVAAEAYRAAQEEGRDPVLAVMYATGHSRRRSLRLISGARDAGFLAPRHNRR